MSAQSYSEGAVKAAFLYRFAAYVEWPSAALGPGSFVIGVAGGDEVAGQLQKLLPGRTVQNRAAEVREVQALSDLKGVQILYVARSSPQHRALLAAAVKQPLLVVTDEEGGLAAGGVINFIAVGHNVRFEVSLPAAERNGLKINAGLLSVAARVERSPQAMRCEGALRGALLACSAHPRSLLAGEPEPPRKLRRSKGILWA
ncbi:MAG: YfiR family protein [Gammaproteobacteria bacterium]|nr:YfiR family protein [Gammaproteobacteria bacterium]MBV9696256.1 YfiR family protein [Gammaproteobacteria bacterium]